MPARRSLALACLLAAAVVTLATGALVLLGSAVVQGPLALTPTWVPVARAEVTLLAVAALCTALVLPVANFSWHADAPVCGALLACVSTGLVVGWEGGPPVVRALSGVIAPLAVPALFALAERRILGTRRLCLVCAAVLLALGMGVLLVRDPYLDPRCWADCSVANMAPLSSAAAGRVLLAGLTWTSVTVAVLGCAVVIAFLAGAAGRQLPWSDRAVAGAAAFAAAPTALVAVIPNREAAVTVATAASALRCLLALAVVAQPALALRRRRRLRHLAADLGEVPPLGSLEAALARALGDRGVRVAYWLPEPGRYVHASGDPVKVDGDWSVTLQRDGQRLAAVRLSTPARDTFEVEHLLGSAARLAIDNERLQAELRAHLVDLRASRQRIIAAGDDTRRRVERDIHDLVQSELLGALFSLAGSGPSSEPAGSAATTEPDPAQLDGQVRALVAGLRRFSQGVYPSMLDRSGLGPALEALTYEAPVLMDLDCEISERLPLDVEHAAYLLVRNAVMLATSNVSVRVALGSPGAVLTVAGSRVVIREYLQDRVGALGGRIHCEEGSFRAELPCA